MKINSYMTRAMKASDQRYARILGKLGYGRRDIVAAPAAAAPIMQAPVDDLAPLRAEYESVVGKRPFMGWDADKLREKIAEAKALTD